MPLLYLVYLLASHLCTQNTYATLSMLYPCRSCVRPNLFLSAWHFAGNQHILDTILVWSTGWPVILPQHQHSIIYLLCCPHKYLPVYPEKCAFQEVYENKFSASFSHTVNTIKPVLPDWATCLTKNFKVKITTT